MLSMPSFDFHFATVYGRLPHPPLPTMAIATLAIATFSLGGTISLCTVLVQNKIHGRARHLLGSAFSGTHRVKKIISNCILNLCPLSRESLSIIY